MGVEPRISSFTGRCLDQLSHSTTTLKRKKEKKSVTIFTSYYTLEQSGNPEPPEHQLDFLLFVCIYLLLQLDPP